MNSLTTDAMGIASLLPLETIRPVLRSRTVIVTSAPAFAASAVARLARASRPAKAAAGSSGGDSGSGALVPRGATTVSRGVDDSGAVPYTLASQPARMGTAMMTAAVAVTTFGGRRRMALPHVCANRNQVCRTAPAGCFSLAGERPHRVLSSHKRFEVLSGRDSTGFQRLR